MAAPGRSDVNICQRLAGALARNRSLGIHPGIHEIAAPAGSALAWFAQRFTLDRHAVGVRNPATVRSQVRTVSTHSGAGAAPVRTGGSHTGSQPP